MKYLLSLICLILSFQWQANAQDERFYRKLFSGDLAISSAQAIKPNPHFQATSSFYEIDLDGDDRVESIIIEKRDEEDWLHIHNYNREKIFSLRFIRKGWRSDVYRVNLRQLSEKTKVLLIQYYEGHNQASNFNGSARLYVVSWDDNDLKTLVGVRGPEVWHEFADSKIHYHQREQHVSLVDFNQDGVREIAVRHHLSAKVMKYLGNGNWHIP